MESGFSALHPHLLPVLGTGIYFLSNFAKGLPIISTHTLPSSWIFTCMGMRMPLPNGYSTVARFPRTRAGRGSWPGISHCQLPSANFLKVRSKTISWPPIPWALPVQRPAKSPSGWSAGLAGVSPSRMRSLRKGGTASPFAPARLAGRKLRNA